MHRIRRGAIIAVVLALALLASLLAGPASACKPGQGGHHPPHNSARCIY